jgi:hypothetical protein
MTLKNGYKYFLWFAVCGLLIYGLGFGAWTVMATETGNGDNVEHLHATWLVAYGSVPYKDFFQHHNPLLWYVFAPIVRHFTNLLSLLDFAHAVSIVGGVLTFWVVYKVAARFFAGGISALISLIILCPPYFYIYCFNFNPDTFMALFYAIGLYFLFSYWQEKKLYALCVAFMSFFIAFLFTQKILMPLFFLGLISLFIFYKQKCSAKDIVTALVLPIICLLLFVALLYHYDALKLYWLSNYPFNVIMQKYYGFRRVDVMNHETLFFSISLSVISVIFFFRNANPYFKVISFLFAVELPLRCFYFSIAPYYMLPLMIYAVCLNSVLIEKIREKIPYLLLVFIGVSGYYAYTSVPNYLGTRGQDRSFARFLDRNVKPCDYVLSSYFGNQSVMNKDPHYYWSMFGHVDMVGEELGIAPHPVMDDLVIKYLPKIIFGGVYKSSYAEHHGYYEEIQRISPDIIENYYMPLSFPDLYLLKYEYRHQNCVYNKVKKEWMYVD